MKRLACAISFLVATGPILVAADSDEPLANVKQELKQLQADSTAQKNGAVDPKLKSALPSILLAQPGAAAEQPNLLRQSEQDRKKQKDKRKDWLLEQYDQLDPKNASAKPEDEIKLADKSLEPKSEHDQLMERLMANDPDGKQAGDDSKKHPRLDAPRAPDPFAPFMKDWLANSPASGPMFDALTKTGGGQTPELFVSGADTRARDASTIAPISMDSVRTNSRGTHADASAPAPNPFLPGLEMAFQHEGAPGTAFSSPVADALQPPSLTSTKDSLVGPTGALGTGKRNSLEPPASKQLEDKKYFPQQKRF